ncbi:hypothetical protein JW926_10420 [Candidatus Sumerlaeota bacterium]|nr:hypothetical protein [Candidatus Sumerlaeota bacterium]
MRSVGLALTWEYWRKGRGWFFSLFILLAVLGVVISYSTGNEGNINSSEQEKMMAYPVFLILPVFILGTLILLIEGDMARAPEEYLKRNRIFILPVSSATLAAWRMLHGMVTASFFSFISIFISHLMYKKQGGALPPFSTALFTTAIFCFYYSCLWYSRRNAWYPIVLITGPIVALCFWYRSLGNVSDALRIIQAAGTLSLEKGIGLVAIIGLSYYLALAGHKSFRRGDFPPILEWATGEKSFRDLFIFKPKRFSSVKGALVWFYSNRDKFKTIQFFSILLLYLTAFILLMFVRLPEDFPSVLMIMSFFIFFYVQFFPMSLVFEKGAYSMGSFESTLPASCGEQSRSILFMKIRKLILGVMINGAMLVLILLSTEYSVNAKGFMSLHEELLDASFWSTGIKGYAAVCLHVLVILWIFWIIIGMSTSFWLSGRCRVWMFGLIIPLTCVTLFLMIWGTLAYPIIIGAIILLGVIFCFYKTVKVGISGKGDIVESVAIWVAVSLAFSFLLYRMERAMFPRGCVMIFVGVALGMLPFALAPMALHGNRRR